MMKSLRWWIMNNFGRFSQAKICFLFIKAVCSHCTQVWKFWSSFFKSLLGFGASSPIISLYKRRSGWIPLRSKGRGGTLVGGSPLIKIIAKHVILSGENDTVCHFRSRTRPQGGREAGSIMSRHLFRPRSQTMLCIIWSSLCSDFD